MTLQTDEQAAPLTPSTDSAESTCGLQLDPVNHAQAFHIRQRPYDPQPPVKVIIVGAGIGGIAASVLLPAKVPNLSYVVYERNETVSGTWTQNRYPGVRCDVPAHAYQFTFAPNPRWSEYYAPGAEIREYYEQIVAEYNVKEHLSLRHEVLRASWNDEIAQWEVKVRNLVTGEVFTDTAHFFVSAQGRLNKPKMPNIPGLLTGFKGHVCHTALWDDSYDFSEKKVAIIGNGASGQQILVNILQKVNHTDHYIRSKQWISPTFAGGLIPARADMPGGYRFTEQEKMDFAMNPTGYVEFRRSLEKNLHGIFKGTVAGSPQNEALRQRCLETMALRLDDDRDWLQRLLPDYAPGCKRTTPAPGYLEALKNPKVTYIDTPISHATSTALVDSAGNERAVDAIIVATGFENGFLPLFPTIGKNNIDLSQQWASNGPVGHPETYFGLMAPDMPNYFAVLQVNRDPIISYISLSRA